jgi:hypothetical protein
MTTLAFDNLRSNLENLEFFTNQIKRISKVLQSTVTIARSCAMMYNENLRECKNDCVEDEILLNAILKIARFASKFSRFDLNFFSNMRQFITNIVDLTTQDKLMDNTIAPFVMTLIDSCEKFNDINNNVNEETFNRVISQFVSVSKQIDITKLRKNAESFEEISLDDFLSSSDSDSDEDENSALVSDSDSNPRIPISSLVETDSDESDESDDDSDDSEVIEESNFVTANSNNLRFSDEESSESKLVTIHLVRFS